MSQETLELLLWILGGLYLVSVIVVYLLYHFSWKKVSQYREELNNLAQSRINRGTVAEEQARNLVKNMQKVLDTYSPVIFKEDKDSTRK